MHTFSFSSRRLFPVLNAMLLPVMFPLLGLAASPPAAADEANSELIHKYLDAAEMQQLALQGVDMEVIIEARLPKLKKQGYLRALRRISPEGQITYQALEASGDSTVRHEIIARYLAAESREREHGLTAITPFNYRFRLKGVIEQPTRQVYVFQIAPKKKRVGLFKGELWVDGQTGMPVHESGQFVKSPSVFVRRIAFVRDYATREGVSIPVYIHGAVESRLVGRAELDIRFSNFALPENPEYKTRVSVASSER